MAEILFTISNVSNNERCYKIVAKDINYSTYNAYYVTEDEVLYEMFKIAEILNNEHCVYAAFDVE